MYKSTRIAIFLILGTTFVQVAAYAADPLPFWGGIRQRAYKNGGQLGPKYYVESDADWKNTNTKTATITLVATKKAIPKGADPPHGAVAAAASVLDFSQADLNGIQLDFIGCLYTKQKSGLVFKDTTDPVLRVEYRNINSPKQKLYKTLGVAKAYPAAALRALGLDPEINKILRVAAVAKPQINRYVDDYAYVDINKMQYHIFVNPSREINHEVPLKLEITNDDGSDPLINF
jgi:hypothetical protein